MVSLASGGILRPLRLSCERAHTMTHKGTKIPAGKYTAIIKPKITRTSSRAQPAVVLVLQPPVVEEAEQIFSFPSWSFLRERLRVFGFASDQELDSADVRLFTGRQPYRFSSRRWELPLIEALDLNRLEP
jgi:hypothetical protein